MMPRITYPEWLAGLVVWVAIVLIVTYVVMSHSDVAWVQQIVTEHLR